MLTYKILISLIGILLSFVVGNKLLPNGNILLKTFFGFALSFTTLATLYAFAFIIYELIPPFTGV